MIQQKVDLSVENENEGDRDVPNLLDAAEGLHKRGLTAAKAGA